MKRWVLLVTTSPILETPLIPTMLQNRIHHSLASFSEVEIEQFADLQRIKFYLLGALHCAFRG